MKERYEVVKILDGDFFGIFDNLVSSTVRFDCGESQGIDCSPREDAVIDICQQLNIEAEEKRKSEEIMKVSGIGGVGVNLCNEFNYIDLHEVLEWIGNTDDSNEHINDALWSLYRGFTGWYYDSTGLIYMKQHEMQTAIVNKIYDLMVEAGLIGGNDES